MYPGNNLFGIYAICVKKKYVCIYIYWQRRGENVDEDKGGRIKSEDE
jgi:hypothetical protein